MKNFITQFPTEWTEHDVREFLFYNDVEISPRLLEHAPFYVLPFSGNFVQFVRRNKPVPTLNHMPILFRQTSLGVPVQTNHWHDRARGYFGSPSTRSPGRESAFMIRNVADMVRVLHGQYGYANKDSIVIRKIDPPIGKLKGDHGPALDAALTACANLTPWDKITGVNGATTIGLAIHAIRTKLIQHNEESDRMKPYLDSEFLDTDNSQVYDLPEFMAIGVCATKNEAGLVFEPRYLFVEPWAYLGNGLNYAVTSLTDIGLDERGYLQWKTQRHGGISHMGWFADQPSETWIDSFVKRIRTRNHIIPSQLGDAVVITHLIAFDRHNIRD